VDLLGDGREKASPNLQGTAMKVVVVYQYYQGLAAPGHSLVYELTQFLAERGHDVSVVSGETGYMHQSTTTLPWYRRIIRTELDGKVNVVRAYTYSQANRTFLGRVIGFISFSFTCPLGLAYVHKPDVILASSPPIFPIFSALLIARLCRIPFVLEVRDLWPESVIQMGILKNRQLINIMAWMERVLYTHSSKIIALTAGIRDDITSRGWPQEKITLVTCGVETEMLYPDMRSATPIRALHNWKDHNVVLYFGAIGEANNLSVLVRTAVRLRSRQDIVIAIIGDGMESDKIAKQIKEQGLTNIFLLPPVPKQCARAYINAADLCVVTLRDLPLFTGAIPTKLIDYMACAKTVLCGVRGEAARILESAEAGVTFEPDDDQRLSELIIDLLRDPELLQRMGASGHAYVQQYFRADSQRTKIEHILRSLANEPEPIDSSTSQSTESNHGEHD
jgi:glycosyltransferase involved in cell wall biosynthesis